MTTDIISLTTHNKETIEIVKSFGYTNIIVLGQKDFSEETTNNTNHSLNIFLGNPETISRATENTRAILEKKKVVLIYNIETIEKKDKLHYRSSGLNQVLCQIAHNNNITIGISFNTILNTTGTVRGILLGRIRQNIILCRKYKVKMFIGSFAANTYEMRSPRDLESFGITLGMTPKEAKESTTFLPKSLSMLKI